MEGEIKLCFNLFVNHMKSNVKDLRTYDASTMTVNQIRGEIDVIYMKYILCSSYSVSDSSIGVVAYNHLKKMIDGNAKGSQLHKLESEVKTLGLENALLRQEIAELKTKVANVLFPTNSLTVSGSGVQSSNQKGWFGFNYPSTQ